MEEKQKQLTAPQPVPSSQKEPAWSIIRVAEGIAINVGSAIVIAILTALVAFLPSIFLLIVQPLFRFLVIPTNWLVVLAVLGGSVLLVLAIIIGLLYRFASRHPTIVLWMLIGAAFGIYFESKPLSDLFKATSAASQKQNAPSDTQDT